MPTPQIDPKTGEVMQAQGGNVQIDPATGEVMQPAPEAKPGLIDRFDKAFVEPQMAPPNESVGHHIVRGMSNFGGGAIGAATAPFLHPVKTLAGIGGLVTEPVEAMVHPGQDEVSQMAKGVMEHPEEGLESLLGGAVGGAVLGEGAGGLSRAMAAPTERGGLNLGNMALGARGPKPFKYGANPARGAFEEGVLPAMSKHSAAMKVENALPQAGQRISDAVMHGAPVPLDDIANSIESPVRGARGIIEGPGGGNRSSEPLNALQESMQRRAPGASRPIYGPGAGDPYTAPEAAQAMSRRSPLLLPSPEEDIPLHSSPVVRGRPSRPIILEGNRATPREFPPYGINTPPEPETYGGMNAQQYMGERPGTMGGGGQPQGVLRQRATYPESNAPSPLSDLRHPHATAPDVWRTIQNIDKNTRFNPDPEVEGVNELRRDIRGGLRGNLEEAVPGLKPLSQRYGDLKGAQESLERTLHSGTSLRKMASVPMFPIESTVGRGMYGTGKLMAKGIPKALGIASPTAGFMSQMRKKEQ